MEFHHIGYNVKSISLALPHWLSLGAVAESDVYQIAAHSVKVQFLTLGGSRIELVEGPSSNHICYICDDFEERVAKAREQGGIVAKPPVASEAFGGRLMCFIVYKSAGLIEWVKR